MKKFNLLILLLIVVLLGIFTGFVVIDFGNFSNFMVPLIGVFATKLIGGTEGGSGNG